MNIFKRISNWFKNKKKGYAEKNELIYREFWVINDDGLVYPIENRRINLKRENATRI